MRVLRYPISLLMACLALAGCLMAQEHAPEQPTLSPRDQQEVEFGKKVVAEIEKHYKFITDAELVERVDRIGQTLAEIAPDAKLWRATASRDLRRFSTPSVSSTRRM
jgi:predicted Zn-dependent protease